MEQSERQRLNYKDLDKDAREFMRELLRLSNYKLVDWILTFTDTRASLNRPSGNPRHDNPPPDQAFYHELARKGFIGMKKSETTGPIGLGIVSCWTIWPTQEATTVGGAFFTVLGDSQSS